MTRKKINVLHIIDGLPMGGPEVLLLTLAANIDRDRVNLMICSLRDDNGPIADMIKRCGIKIFALNSFRFRDRLKTMIKLAKIIREEKIDIIHTHMKEANFIGRLTAAICGVPVICKTRHAYRGSGLKGFPAYRGYLKLNALLDYLTDMVVYVSRHQMGAFKKRERNRCVIYNGFYEERLESSPEAGSKTRAELGVLPDEILIGTVGRLHKLKGQEYLLRAVSLIKKSAKNVKIKLLLVGDGDGEGELRSLTDRLMITENVIFFGKTEKISPLLQAMDIYVNPALWEACGIAIIEAMYCEVPVAATDVGGNPEIIENGVSGILVEPENPDAISHAVLELIKNPLRAAELARNGKSRALSQYTGKIYGKNISDLYERLMDKKKGK